MSIMRSTVRHFDIHSRSTRLIVKFALFIIYLTVLCYGLFFADSMGRSVEHGTYNTIPFREIRRFVSYAGNLGWESVAVNLLGNIIAFVPFGFIITSFLPSDDKYHPLGVTGLGFLFSLTVEWLQFMTSVGAADVDDIILNTIGSFAGYLLYIMYWRLTGDNE